MKWISSLLLIVLCHSSQATEMVGAISAGMGGTGRAAVESIESLYLNPASLALIEEFHFGAAYQTGFLHQDISRNTYSVNLSDGTKGVMFPGSLGYRSHKITQGGESFKEQEIKIGFGHRLTERINIGLAYTYLDGEGRAGAAHKQHNVDAGALVGLMPNWGLSLTGENLIKRDENLPLAFQRPSRIALGTQLIVRSILVARYEVLTPLYENRSDLLTHRFGMGALLKSNFMLNLGYSVDDLSQQNWASGGLVWRGPRLKLAYSIQNESRQQLGNRHLVDLWLDF